MKESLGIALLAIAAFLTIGDAFIACMAIAAPEGLVKTILRSAFAAAVVIVVVLVAAGLELVCHG